jgi:hypothetical protein
MGSFFGSIKKPSFYIFPVDNFPDLLDVVHPNIFIVNIVCMFPYINGYNKGKKILKRGVKPCGASISWLGSSTILRAFEEFS